MGHPARPVCGSRYWWQQSHISEARCGAPATRLEGYLDPITMLWVLTFNHAVNLEAVLLKSPLLVFGVSDPIRCILRAFTALQHFAVDFEPNELSTCVFAYCNHSAHAPILRPD